MSKAEQIAEGERNIQKLTELPPHNRPVINKVNQMTQLLIEILNDVDRGEQLHSDCAMAQAIEMQLSMTGMALATVLRDAYGRRIEPCIAETTYSSRE